MFVDKVKIKFIAGKGGNGVVAWHRAKYIPKGGPAGGNGGKGGSIVLQVDNQVPSLEWFRNRFQLKAEPGGQGGGNNRTGKCGQNLVLKVPCGTLVKDVETGEIIKDLTEHGEEWQICEGGYGGRGNTSFKTPTNRAPNKCTHGREGSTMAVEMELKLIADVGFVGFPNAGKSTLINGISRVPVKIAPYPFTTLRPNLGYVQFDDFSRILIADIPGIIEGAHENKGLGYEFLRHIERTSVLVYLLDASGVDGRTPIDDFKVLKEELEAYNPEMVDKPYLVALNKIDTEESLEHVKEFRAAYSFPPNTLFEISALDRVGLEPLTEAMRELAQRDGKRF